MDTLPKQLTDQEQLDFAWRAHEANIQWVRGVDQKASIVLIVAVALSGVFANQAFEDHGALAHATGLRLGVAITAGICLALAGIAALWGVRPRLNAKQSAKHAGVSLIYFGHLRHRKATEIDRAISELTAESARADLARQLEAHGSLSWAKHWSLQRSLELLFIGAVAFAVAQFAL